MNIFLLLEFQRVRKKARYSLRLKNSKIMKHYYATERWGTATNQTPDCHGPTEDHESTGPVPALSQSYRAGTTCAESKLL